MANRLTPSHRVLFPAFLEDHEVYQQAEAYWQMLFEALFSTKDIPFHRYYNTISPDGEKDYTGNPIFDAYFPGNTSWSALSSLSPRKRINPASISGKIPGPPPSSTHHCAPSHTTRPSRWNPCRSW
ncbi:MAG: hypothetical protein IPN33_09450 [Saprospiraceae bacterium]|nr:hypothetical protein [Saprospiraceae bacterium]